MLWKPVLIELNKKTTSHLNSIPKSQHKKQCIWPNHFYINTTMRFCLRKVWNQSTLFYFTKTGIEAEAVMLGQAISMLLPEVIGYHITGSLDQYATSTDLVLTITKVEIDAQSHNHGSGSLKFSVCCSICDKLVSWGNLLSSSDLAWLPFPSQTELPFPTCALSTEPLLASSLWMKQLLPTSGKQVGVCFLFI